MKAHAHLEQWGRQMWLFLEPMNDQWGVRVVTAYSPATSSSCPSGTDPNAYENWLVRNVGFETARKVYRNEKAAKVRRRWTVLEAEQEAEPVNQEKNLEWLRALRHYKKGLRARLRLGVWKISNYSSSSWNEDSMVQAIYGAMVAQDFSQDLLVKLAAYMAIPRRARKCDNVDRWRLSEQRAHLSEQRCGPCARAAIDLFFTRNSRAFRQLFGAIES
jgi:hypothetical protein